MPSTASFIPFFELFAPAYTFHLALRPLSIFYAAPIAFPSAHPPFLADVHHFPHLSSRPRLLSSPPPFLDPSCPLSQRPHGRRDVTRPTRGRAQTFYPFAISGVIPVAKTSRKYQRLKKSTLLSGIHSFLGPSRRGSARDFSAAVFTPP